MASREIHDTVALSTSLASLDDKRFPLSPLALFFMMLAVSDNWGRLSGEIRKIRASCIPLFDRSEADVAAAAEKLQRVPRIAIGTVADIVVCQILDFDHWQRNNVRRRKGVSHFPELPGLDSLTTGTQQGLYDSLYDDDSGEWVRDAHGERISAQGERIFAQGERLTHERAPMEVGSGSRRSSLSSSEVKTAAASPAAVRGRRRDPLWEELLSSCGIDATALTESGRGAANRALRQLQQVGADADQIRRRATEYRRRFQLPITPAALAKHWASLDATAGEEDNFQEYNIA